MTVEKLQKEIKKENKSFFNTIELERSYEKQYEHNKMKEKIKKFAELLEKQQIERLYSVNLACQGNIDNCKVSIKEGKKYIKIDVGTSGKYMIDLKGNIFGIKAYGVIHKGHYFGTLDTINAYYWGDYKAYKI